MPDADSLLVKVFHEIGMATTNGMAATAFTFTELDHYCNRMRVNLTAWESMQIISMSRDYCAWTHKGRDKDCVSPWSDSDQDAIRENRDKVAAQMKEMRGKKK